MECMQQQCYAAPGQVQSAICFYMTTIAYLLADGVLAFALLLWTHCILLQFMLHFTAAIILLCALYMHVYAP
jgi:cytochrome b subunit of formate dehydrogenase